MEREDAIRILDPDTTVEALAEIEYYNGFSGREAVLKAVDDACVLAVAALREQEERENPQPLTLDELKLHLSKRHPNEIEPLYVVFYPPVPVDFAPRWRDAYNLSMLIAQNAVNYGKLWNVYRSKPKEE